MSKSLALIWAVIGAALLAGISYAFAARSLALILAFSAASLLFIGAGFIVKAKLRKRKEQG